MGNFSNNALTDAGRILLADVQMGAVFTPTRIVIGSGYLPAGTTVRSIKAVVTPVKTLSIGKKQRSNDGTVILGGVYSNEDIAEAFYFRELGLYAKAVYGDGRATEEVLYSYGNAGGSADLMPPYSTGTAVERQIDIATYIGNDAQVDLTIASGIYVTEERLQAETTPNKLLEKLREVDGTGSGLDADTLGGKHLKQIYVTAGAKMSPAKYATSEGRFTSATGEHSHAEGFNTNAIGLNSHSEGYSTTASGDDSHAEGSTTTASGYYTHSEGYSTTASGSSSHAEGFQTKAVGGDSHAEGHYTVAKGSYSHAGGFSTIASNRQYAIGSYNAETKGVEFGSTANPNGNYLVIGNGSGQNSRSNAFRFAANGKLYCQQAYSATGADYAEYVEWLDGNSTQEDRRGLLVTLEGDKLRLATAQDDYILGVISSNPTVIGNDFADDWQGRFVRDVFGDIQMEQYHAPAVKDGEGNVIQEAYDYVWYAQSSEYDPERVYSPRGQRSEWAMVGMMGQLVLVDDGTCQPNGYCLPSNGGIATASTDQRGYRVLRRKDENHIVAFVHGRIVL